MANIIRKNDQGQVSPSSVVDPFQIMREMLNWDPFHQIAPFYSGGERGISFAPQFEVKETKDGYVFKADLPGIEEKDLEVTLTGSRLTVSGKREAERRNEGENYFAYERSYGNFSRSFTLPEGIDTDHVSADLKNGVLTLVVPKRPEHQPKKISLKGLGDKVKGVFGEGDKGKA